MNPLGRPNQAYAGDTGAPDPAVREALAAAASGEREAYLHAVAALCTTRLLLPIGPAQDGDLAAILLASPQGRRAVVVFTGADLFAGWAKDARPVPCTLDDVAATAVETGAEAILVDPGAGHAVALEGEVVRHLAAGRRLVALRDGGWGWMFRSGPTDSPRTSGVT